MKELLLGFTQSLVPFLTLQGSQALDAHVPADSAWVAQEGLGRSAAVGPTSQLLGGSREQHENSPQTRAGGSLPGSEVCRHRASHLPGSWLGCLSFPRRAGERGTCSHPLLWFRSSVSQQGWVETRRERMTEEERHSQREWPWWGALRDRGGVKKQAASPTICTQGF